MLSIGEKAIAPKVESSKEMNATENFFKKISYQFMTIQKLTEQHENSKKIMNDYFVDSS
jgi:hypothetical protein